jgi:hypothetical protein
VYLFSSWLQKWAGPCCAVWQKGLTVLNHWTTEVSQPPLQISHGTAIYHSPLIYSFSGDRKAWQIRNRPTFKHVTFSRKYKYKEKQYFVDTRFWHNVCLQHNCLVVGSSQFDELCGLRNLLFRERYVIRIDNKKTSMKCIRRSTYCKLSYCLPLAIQNAPHETPHKGIGRRVSPENLEAKHMALPCPRQL